MSATQTEKEFWRNPEGTMSQSICTSAGAFLTRLKSHYIPDGSKLLEPIAVSVDLAKILDISLEAKLSRGTIDSLNRFIDHCRLTRPKEGSATMGAGAGAGAGSSTSSATQVPIDAWFHDRDLQALRELGHRMVGFSSALSQFKVGGIIVKMPLDEAFCVISQALADANPPNLFDSSDTATYPTDPAANLGLFFNYVVGEIETEAVCEVGLRHILVSGMNAIKYPGFMFIKNSNEFLYSQLEVLLPRMLISIVLKTSVRAFAVFMYDWISNDFSAAFSKWNETSQASFLAELKKRIMQNFEMRGFTRGSKLHSHLVSSLALPGLLAIIDAVGVQCASAEGGLKKLSGLVESHGENSWVKGLLERLKEVSVPDGLKVIDQDAEKIKSLLDDTDTFCSEFEKYQPSDAVIIAAHEHYKAVMATLNLENIDQVIRDVSKSRVTLHEFVHLHSSGHFALVENIFASLNALGGREETDGREIKVLLKLFEGPIAMSDEAIDSQAKQNQAGVVFLNVQLINRLLLHAMTVKRSAWTAGFKTALDHVLAFLDGNLEGCAYPESLKHDSYSIKLRNHLKVVSSSTSDVVMRSHPLSRLVHHLKYAELLYDDIYETVAMIQPIWTYFAAKEDCESAVNVLFDLIASHDSGAGLSSSYYIESTMRLRQINAEAVVWRMLKSPALMRQVSVNYWAKTLSEMRDKVAVYAYVKAKLDSSTDMPLGDFEKIVSLLERGEAAGYALRYLGEMSDDMEVHETGEAISLLRLFNLVGDGGDRIQQFFASPRSNFSMVDLKNVNAVFDCLPSPELKNNFAMRLLSQEPLSLELANQVARFIQNISSLEIRKELMIKVFKQGHSNLLQGDYSAIFCLDWPEMNDDELCTLVFEYLKTTESNLVWYFRLRPAMRELLNRPVRLKIFVNRLAEYCQWEEEQGSGATFERKTRNAFMFDYQLLAALMARSDVDLDIIVIELRRLTDQFFKFNFYDLLRNLKMDYTVIKHLITSFGDQAERVLSGASRRLFDDYDSLNCSEKAISQYLVFLLDKCPKLACQHMISDEKALKLCQRLLMVPDKGPVVLKKLFKLDYFHRLILPSEGQEIPSATLSFLGSQAFFVTAVQSSRRFVKKAYRYSSISRFLEYMRAFDPIVPFQAVVSKCLQVSIACSERPSVKMLRDLVPVVTSELTVSSVYKLPQVDAYAVSIRMALMSGVSVAAILDELVKKRFFEQLRAEVHLSQIEYKNWSSLLVDLIGNLSERGSYRSLFLTDGFIHLFANCLQFGSLSSVRELLNDHFPDFNLKLIDCVSGLIREPGFMARGVEFQFKTASCLDKVRVVSNWLNFLEQSPSEQLDITHIKNFIFLCRSILVDHDLTPIIKVIVSKAQNFKVLMITLNDFLEGMLTTDSENFPYTLFDLEPIEFDIEAILTFERVKHLLTDRTFGIGSLSEVESLKEKLLACYANWLPHIKENGTLAEQPKTFLHMVDALAEVDVDKSVDLERLIDQVGSAYRMLFACRDTQTFIQCCQLIKSRSQYSHLGVHMLLVNNIHDINVFSIATEAELVTFFTKLQKELDCSTLVDRILQSNYHLHTRIEALDCADRLLDSLIEKDVLNPADRIRYFCELDDFGDVSSSDSELDMDAADDLPLMGTPHIPLAYVAEVGLGAGAGYGPSASSLLVFPDEDFSSRVVTPIADFFLDTGGDGAGFGASDDDPANPVERELKRHRSGPGL